MMVDPSPLRRGRLVYGGGDSSTEGEIRIRRGRLVSRREGLSHLRRGRLIYRGGDSYTEGETRLLRGRLGTEEGRQGNKEVRGKET
jgi:hypothetical protein